MHTATDSGGTANGTPTGTPATMQPAQPTSATQVSIPFTGAPACPKCGGRMWDNRANKRNPRAPDFKCRRRSCDGVLWPGQHHAATPIITARHPQPDSAADERGEAAPTVAAPNGATDPGSPARLRRCYLDLAEFVLREVRPKYDAAGVPCHDATVAAITATLFIAACRREGD